MVERALISLPSQQQLTDRLQHLIYLSSSLILVSGEAGSGKSTLSENLSNVLDSDLQQIYLSLTPSLSADKIRQQIVGQLYDQPLFNPEENLLDTVLRLQASESKESKKLFIIDNAHYLPEGFIIELCELFSGDDFVRDSTLNIVLLSDEQSNQAHLAYIEDHLIARMQSALNDVEFKLPPLTDEESFSLLQHYFKQAAFQPDAAHEASITTQLKACHGNPQKIIQLVNSLTQAEVLPSRRYWLKTALPAVVMMLLLVALVSALGSYLYPKFIAQPEILTDEADIMVANKAQREAFLAHHLIQEKRMEEALAGAWDEDELAIEHPPQPVEPAKQKVDPVTADEQDEAQSVMAEQVPETQPLTQDIQSPAQNIQSLTQDIQKPVPVDTIVAQHKDSEKESEGGVVENDNLPAQEDEPNAVTYRLPATAVKPVEPLQLGASEEGVSLDNPQNTVASEQDRQQIIDNKTLLSSIREVSELIEVDQESAAPLDNIAQPSQPAVSAPIVNLPSAEKVEKVQTVDSADDVVQPIDDTLNVPTLAENTAVVENSSPGKKQSTEKTPIIETAVKAIETVAKAVPIKVTNIDASVNEEGLTPNTVLFSKPALRYTLQLSGMASKRYVDLFKLQSDFPRENLYLYQTTFQKKPWFVVLYGDYATIPAAQAAAKNLPGALNGMQSWVKQWQRVHNELRLNNE